MRNVTHEALGVAATTGVCAVLDYHVALTVACAALSLPASWLPDADQPGARIHRRSRLERRNIVAGTAGLCIRPLMVLFAALVGHRGVTHWLITCAGVSAVATATAAAVNSALAAPVAVAVTSGYLMHLLADACTPSGVPLLAPFSRRRVHLLPAGRRIRTGSSTDLAIGAAAAALSVVLVAVA